MAEHISIEVQAIIEEAVDTVKDHSNRNRLIDLIVRALESDASWIQQYGMTGEIVLPEASLGEGLVGESLEQSHKRVKEVHHHSNEFVLRSYMGMTLRFWPIGRRARPLQEHGEKWLYPWTFHR